MIATISSNTPIQELECQNSFSFRDAYYLWTAREITKWIRSSVDFPIDPKFFPRSTGELKEGIELHVASLNDQDVFFLHVPNGRIEFSVSGDEKFKILKIIKHPLGLKKTKHSCVNCSSECTTMRKITKWENRNISTHFVENDIQMRDLDDIKDLFNGMNHSPQVFHRVFSLNKSILQVLRDRELGIK